MERSRKSLVKFAKARVMIPCTLLLGSFATFLLLALMFYLGFTYGTVGGNQYGGDPLPKQAKFRDREYWTL